MFAASRERTPWLVVRAVSASTVAVAVGGGAAVVDMAGTVAADCGLRPCPGGFGVLLTVASAALSGRGLAVALLLPDRCAVAQEQQG